MTGGRDAAAEAGLRPAIDAAVVDAAVVDAAMVDVAASAVGQTPVAQTLEPAAHHGMHLDPDVRKDVTRRLRIANGHLEGVLRMLDDPSVYCVDVLKQVKAVQGALGKVNEAVLRSHVRDHVVTAAQRGDADVIVDELMEALKYRS